MGLFRLGVITALNECVGNGNVIERVNVIFKTLACVVLRGCYGRL